ncbi:MAG: hypothetical protein M1837_005480 [Sclerophora amabilis]|nr:MAG: hypothetical protein M1837_005480 [Sclerophora amabilis]
MPKRKREQRFDQPGVATEQLNIEVGKRLVHGKKRLNQSLKTARAFERQKLAKRIRHAGEAQESEQVPRLERELEIVKTLNLPQVAGAHLHKTLLRSKDFSTAAALSDDLLKLALEDSQPTESTQCTARMNVLARLYNTKHVKSELSNILKGIADLLGLQVAEDSGQQNKHPPTPAEGKHKQVRIENALPNTLDSIPRENSIPSTVIAHLTEHHDESSLPSDENEKVLSRYDGQVASTSSEEEFGNETQASVDTARPKAPTTTYDPSADLSLSPSETGTASSTPPPSKLQRSIKKPSASDSTFLPSLMMSGYWSGSETAEDNVEEVEPRKNRRGQRARREIWEKKYGTKANHMKTESRDGGWDPRRGATGRLERNGRNGRTSRDTFGSKPGRARYGNDETSTGANNIAVKSRTAPVGAVDKPLHPSWQAAKKAKEQKKTATFQGKKVIFD